MPTGDRPAAAAPDRARGHLVTACGKTWRTWQIDRDQSFPTGIPQPMMGSTRDGRISEPMPQDRGRRFGTSAAALREDCADIPEPCVLPHADAWQGGGTVRLKLEEVPVRHLRGRRRPARHRVPARRGRFRRQAPTRRATASVTHTGEEETVMPTFTERRQAMKRFGLGLAAGAAGLAAGRASQAAPASTSSLIPAGAKTLQGLAGKLARAPRRRDYRTVPMILNAPDQWDHEALTEVLAYRGGPKQAWDNTEIAGPWLNLMRNSTNAQVWSFKHPDFLCVSATHGSAHLALYDDEAWAKYQLAKLAGSKFPTNTLAAPAVAPTGNAADYEAEDGAFSGKHNSIPLLQRRGVAFLACHNAIWELGGRLIEVGVNPDHLSHEALAADLTNHVIPGVIVTPGAVATLVELQHAGFTYGK